MTKELQISMMSQQYDPSGKTSTRTGRSPWWAYVLSCGLVAVAFFMFVFTLDRYPTFYSDEEFFNESAARCAEGRSFAFIAKTQAPHSGEIMAFHGPFFPCLQVAVFRLLGTSHFSARIASYTAGHLAVLILCLFLLRQGLWKSAIALALVWLGDRSTQQVMLGRPDGCSILFVSLAFVALARAVQPAQDRIKKRTMLEMCGLSVGMAAGFHPAGALFLLAVVVILVLFNHSNTWMEDSIALALGALIPAGLWLLCWIPDLTGSIEQFLWGCSTGFDRSILANLKEILSLGPLVSWAQYWHFALAIASALILFPISVLIARKCVANRSASIVAAATAFALTGIAIYVNSNWLEKYYLLYFTMWPVIGLSVALETYVAGGVARKVVAATSVVLVLAWCPSLAWNVMRVREAVLWYQALDRRPFVAEIRRHIPQGSPTVGNPVLYVVAREAGLMFDPLPFFLYDCGLNIPDDAWLLVDPVRLNSLKAANPRSLAGRPLVHAGAAFDSLSYTAFGYSIYGPIQSPGKTHGVSSPGALEDANAEMQ